MASKAMDAAKETGSAMMDFAKDVVDNYGDAVKDIGEATAKCAGDFIENA